MFRFQATCDFLLKRVSKDLNGVEEEATARKEAPPAKKDAPPAKKDVVPVGEIFCVLNLCVLRRNTGKKAQSFLISRTHAIWGTFRDIVGAAN